MPKGFQKGHIPHHKGKTIIFSDPIGRALKISLTKTGVKRPPLSVEWRRKISESGKLSNSGKYERTAEIREKLRLANIGKKLSPEHKAKITAGIIALNKSRSGAKHHNWKGGITPENEKIRASRRYARWRTAVFERDKYTCVWCGARNGNGKAVYFEADHIKPFAKYPDLRFELSNGRTLCEDCHKKTPSYGYKK